MIFSKKDKIIKEHWYKTQQYHIRPRYWIWKNLKHNITILRNISIYHSLGLPILLGISRKRFIKDLSKNNDSLSRIGGTTSTSIFAMMNGIQLLRVHDVNEINQSIKVFKELIK